MDLIIDGITIRNRDWSLLEVDCGHIVEAEGHLQVGAEIHCTDCGTGQPIRSAIHTAVIG